MSEFDVLREPTDSDHLALQLHVKIEAKGADASEFDEFINITKHPMLTGRFRFFYKDSIIRGFNITKPLGMTHHAGCR